MHRSDRHVTADSGVACTEKWACPPVLASPALVSQTRYRIRGMPADQTADSAFIMITTA
ncbi:hypothetical protein [Crateriforma conspicua]|uniref:hypothetical protein n=1 Tax=Crateriforma conspicua TaxID=2527996 RepID=UPI0013FD0508|nr:hypothetical protein [Crateriforma conspicua]